MIDLYSELGKEEKSSESYSKRIASFSARMCGCWQFFGNKYVLCARRSLVHEDESRKKTNPTMDTNAIKKSIDSYVIRVRLRISLPLGGFVGFAESRSGKS